MLLFTNEHTFEKIRADRYSILGKVRNLAKEGDVDVTLSMAFALGSEDYNELDQIAEELLELAQTRGGDQVALPTRCSSSAAPSMAARRKPERNNPRRRCVSRLIRSRI